MYQNEKSVKNSVLACGSVSAFMTGQVQTWHLLFNRAVEELTQPQAQENQLLWHQPGQLCLGPLPRPMGSQLQSEPAMALSMLNFTSMANARVSVLQLRDAFFETLLRNGKTEQLFCSMATLVPPLSDAEHGERANATGDGSHRWRAISLATWLQRRDSVCNARITLTAELLTTSSASTGSR